MKQITQIGASIEEAISLALQKLKTTRDQVEVKVLQEGKKGFLGFGAKPAEVLVTIKEVEDVSKTISTDNKAIDLDNSLETQKLQVQTNDEELEIYESEQVQIDIAEEEQSGKELNEDPYEKAKEYITNIAKEMGIDDLRIQTESDGKRILLKLESEKAALLIGKHGATLNALQQLTQLVVNNTAKTYITVTLDVENYRERRQSTLEQLADRMADKAVRTGRKVSLEPMPSYERKIIHNALANRIDIETYSEGIEPNRYLVIEPLR